MIMLNDRHNTVSARRKWRMAALTALVAATAAMAACYSNNCPLDNSVTCQYGFYDSEGTAIKYGDTITVSTLMPGMKTVYTYRKIGNRTVTKDYQDSSLVKQGYTEEIAQQRKDTVLINNIYGAASISLPMSYYRDRDTLIVSYRNVVVKDTIWVTHRSFPYVELPECGTYRFHTLSRIESTNAAIDHIEISNPNVDYEGNENVKVYFNGIASDESEE